MLATNLVLRQMEGAGTKLNIVIPRRFAATTRSRRVSAVGRARTPDDRMRDTGGGLAADAGPGGHADLVRHPARQRRARWLRRQQPL